jgi:hypothetical protein
MSYCSCFDCRRDFDELRSQIRGLELEVEQLRADLRREIDDRRDAIHQVANDLSDLSWSTQP